MPTSRCKFWSSRKSNPDQRTILVPSWNFWKPWKSDGEERYAQGWSGISRPRPELEHLKNSRLKVACSRQVSGGHAAGRSATGLHMCTCRHSNTVSHTWQKHTKTMLWGPEASTVDLGSGRSARLHTKSHRHTLTHIHFCITCLPVLSSIGRSSAQDALMAPLGL